MPTEELIGRIRRCKLEGIAPFAAEWIPRLEASLASLKAGADAYKAAQDAYIEAFKIELGLRSEHYLALDKLMGVVRTAFPNDRARQDLVFPVLDNGGEDLESIDDSGGEGEAGGGSETG